MRAWKTERTIAAGGTLSLSGLPFPVGEAVEVIVIERSDSGGTPEHRAPERWRTLAGTVVKYADPTGPVGVDDWDALR